MYFWYVNLTSTKFFFKSPNIFVVFSLITLIICIIINLIFSICCLFYAQEIRGESDEKIDTIFMKLRCEVNIRQNGIVQEDFFTLKNKSKILNQLQHKHEFSVSVTFFILACDYTSYTKVALHKNSPQYEA